MKKVFLSASIILMSSAVFAQLSKEEKKEWGKKMKSTSVEDFKDLIEGKDRSDALAADLELEVSSLNEENSRLQQELDELKSQMAESTASEAAVDVASDVIEATEEAGEEVVEQQARPSSENVPGLVYKVQIGAYKGIDLKKYFDNYKNFSGEVGDDGVLKYTLGVFKDYWEADQFKKYLREMGVKDAWVVSYKDGNRIPIKDALEGAH